MSVSVMSNYNRPFESNGEYLALYLQRNFLGFGDSIWNNLGSVLLPSNRSSEWVAAFQEMTVLQLTRKLISAGEAILSRYGLKIDEAKDDPVLEREIKNMIFDTMVIHWEDVNAIFVRLVPAIRSSTKPVTKGVRNEVIGFAKREAFCCYLCGVKLTSLKDRDDTATLDHVWPFAYGGDSVYENLLVACRMCNNLKRNTPAWAMYPIQSPCSG